VSADVKGTTTELSCGELLGICRVPLQRIHDIITQISMLCFIIAKHKGAVANPKHITSNVG